MADITVALSLPDPATGVQLKEKYKDMGDGTHARVVSNAAGGGGGGSGDVVGPASAVNNGLALFDSTTGKLIKDGGTLATALAALGVYAPASPTLTVPELLSMTSPNGGGLLTVSISAAGADYVEGERVSADTGGSGGIVRIMSVDGTGGATAIKVYQAGDDYSVSSGASTTTITGIGAGLTVNVDSIAGLPVVIPAQGANKIIWPQGTMAAFGIGTIPMADGGFIRAVWGDAINEPLTAGIKRDVTWSDAGDSYFGQAVFNSWLGIVNDTDTIDPRNKPVKLYSAQPFTDDTGNSDIQVVFTIPYVVQTVPT